MFRPGLSDRGRYYAVTFLNQIPMSNRPQEGGSALAQKLIDVYFSLFKLLLEGRLGTAAARQEQQQQQKGGGKGKGKHRHQHPPKRGRGGNKNQQQQQNGGRDNNRNKKNSGGGASDDDDAAAEGGSSSQSVQQAGELDSRMLSALITGVRRAFPYVESDKVEPLVDGHGEALFKLVHTAPFTVALQVQSVCVVCVIWWGEEDGRVWCMAAGEQEAHDACWCWVCSQRVPALLFSIQRGHCYSHK